MSLEVDGQRVQHLLHGDLLLLKHPLFDGGQRVAHIGKSRHRHGKPLERCGSASGNVPPPLDALFGQRGLKGAGTIGGECRLIRIFDGVAEGDHMAHLSLKGIPDLLKGVEL